MANGITQRAAFPAQPCTARAHRMLHAGTRLAAVCGVSFTNAVAYACPDCNVGRVARAQFWSDGFAQNLAYAAAPFIVIIGASLLAERLDRRPRSSAKDEASHGQ